MRTITPDAKRAALALIERAYSALGADDTESERNKLLAICVAEEREHRRHHEGEKWNITRAQSARMFAVRSIAQSLLQPDRYTVADVLACKESVIYAHALTLRYRDRFAKALDGFDLEALAALDYVALVNS